MIKNIYSMIGSIHFETELLEAHDWDEEAQRKTIEKVIEYFSVCQKSDLDLVKADLGFVFDENIANVIFKYIDRVNAQIIIGNEEKQSEH